MTQRCRACRTPYLLPASVHRRPPTLAADPVPTPAPSPPPAPISESPSVRVSVLHEAGRRLAVGLAGAVGPILVATVKWWTHTH